MWQVTRDDVVRPGRVQATRWISDIYDSFAGFEPFADYYDHSDFSNFGYWLADTTSQREACENLMERLLALLPDKHGKILDVACGKGATTRHLLRHFPPNDVVGINLAERQLEVCRRNAPACAFLRMDATELGFADSSFDNMICVEAAFHFDTREQFLLEAVRVLKPGGRLVLSDILLPPWSLSQPSSNWIRGVDEYRRLLRSVGDVDVTVIDATEECWRGFVRHLVVHMYDLLFAGDIGRPYFRSVMRWLRRMHPQRYLLARLRKRQSPPDPRSSSERGP